MGCKPWCQFRLWITKFPPGISTILGFSWFSIFEYLSIRFKCKILFAERSFCQLYPGLVCLSVHPSRSGPSPSKSISSPSLSYLQTFIPARKYLSDTICLLHFGHILEGNVVQLYSAEKVFFAKKVITFLELLLALTEVLTSSISWVNFSSNRSSNSHSKQPTAKRILCAFLFLMLISGSVEWGKFL